MSTTETDTDTALNKLLTSSEFRDLHTYVEYRDDTFSILKIESAELQHAALLRWLLSPEGEHGFGKKALVEFFAALFEGGQVCGPDRLSAFSDWSFPKIQALRLEGAVVNWEETLEQGLGRADLIIHVENSDNHMKPLVMIEHKVNASQHGDQLSRYVTWADLNISRWPVGEQPPVLVYLSPKPSGDMMDRFVEATYDDVLLPWLQRLLQLGGSERARFLITDYIRCLRRHENVEDKELQKLLDLIQSHDKADEALYASYSLLIDKRSELDFSSDELSPYANTFRVLGLVSRVVSYGDSAFVIALRERLRQSLDEPWLFSSGAASLKIRYGAKSDCIAEGLTVQLWLEAPRSERVTMSLEVVGPKSNERSEFTEKLRSAVTDPSSWPGDTVKCSGETKVVRCGVPTAGIRNRSDDHEVRAITLRDPIETLAGFAIKAAELVEQILTIC